MLPVPAIYKNILLLLCCIGFLATAGCKKEDAAWHLAQKIDSHTTDRLNEVLFLNDTLGFAVGGERFYSATILTTRDGGTTWTATDFPQAGKGLYGITTDKNNHVYICGFDGKLVYSLDYGQSWQFSQLTQWSSFKELAFAGDKCIAVGGISFINGYRAVINTDPATSNVGINIAQWDTTVYEFYDIEMATAQTGYISGFGVMLKTTDGGNNWHLLDVNNDNFTGVSVLNENQLWICGYNGSIRYSENGGKDWETLRKANNALGTKYRLLDILFTDHTHGWATGEDGLVIYTTDGGRNWAAYESFTTSALRHIVKTPDNNIMVCGDGGALYKLKAQ